MNENEREQTKSLFECFRPRRKLESESEGSVEKTVKNVTKLSQGLPGLRDTQVMNTPKKSQPSPPPKKASTSNKAVGGGEKVSTPYMILRLNGSRRGDMAGSSKMVVWWGLA